MYKKIRFFTRFVVVLFKKYYLALAGGLFLGVIVYLIIPPLLSRLPIFHYTQKTAVVGHYTLTNLPLKIQQQVSLGLTTLDASGLPQPALASRWEATDSGKTYIFTLDPTFRWQNGLPVVSRDINYRFNDVKIEYPDDTHLVMKLPDSYSPLPTIVSRPLFLLSGFPRQYYGLGSYKIQSFRQNGQYLDNLTLKSVSDPTLPNLKYYFYASQEQARIAFKLGIVSSIEELTDIGDLSSWPNVRLTKTSQTNRYVAVFFNLRDPNLTGTSGKNLRLALSYAVDKSRWSSSERALGPINPSSWAYYSDVKPYNRDLSRSKELLTKVEKIPSSITLSVVPTYLDIANLIKKDWEELGIATDIRVSQDVPDNFTAIIVGQSIPSDPDQYNLWHSTQLATNLTNLNNPRIDKLLEDGRKTMDFDQRLKIYQDFQRFLLEEAPAVFLYYPHNYSITKK